MEEMVIRLEQIKKYYGDTKVLDVNISFEKGKIYGLIGRNGSGKTMLMKMICGFTFPTEGKVFVRGKEIGRDIDVPENVGIIIEEPGFLPGYSAYHNLYFLSKFRGEIGSKEIYAALEAVGLGDVGKKKVGKFSMGMRQRLGIAQAIMEDPDILLLDEPMNGLDDQGVEEVRNLLLSLKAKGKTILIASHNRDDLKRVCDEVYRMSQGKIVRRYSMTSRSTAEEEKELE